MHIQWAKSQLFNMVVVLINFITSFQKWQRQQIGTMSSSCRSQYSWNPKIRSKYLHIHYHMEDECEWYKTASVVKIDKNEFYRMTHLNKTTRINRLSVFFLLVKRQTFLFHIQFRFFFPSLPRIFFSLPLIVFSMHMYAINNHLWWARYLYT